MKLLLDDKYAPITSAIGFLKCPAKQAAEAYINWMQPLMVNDGQFLQLTHQVYTSLPEILNTLPPLTTADYLRELFVQTNSEWTAYFENGAGTSDVGSTMRVLARRIGCQSIRMEYTPNSLNGNYDKNKGRYGGTILEIYAPHEVAIHNTLRSVCAVNDGSRWVFDASGEVQPYEEVEAYKAKRVRDRFTPEMLDRYLQALGIHAFDEQFYLSQEGFYRIEKTGHMWPSIQYYTLAEARARFE